MTVQSNTQVEKILNPYLNDEKMSHIEPLDKQTRRYIKI